MYTYLTVTLFVLFHLVFSACFSEHGIVIKSFPAFTVRPVVQYRLRGTRPTIAVWKPSVVAVSNYCVSDSMICHAASSRTAAFLVPTNTESSPMIGSRRAFRRVVPDPRSGSLLVHQHPSPKVPYTSRRVHQ